MPGVGAGPPAIAGIGVEQPQQVLLGDEAGGSEEISLRQAEPLRATAPPECPGKPRAAIANGRCPRHRSRRRWFQATDRGRGRTPLRGAADESAAEQPDDASLDRFAGTAACFVTHPRSRTSVPRDVRSADTREERKARRLRPPGDRDDVGSAAARALRTCAARLRVRSCDRHPRRQNRVTSPEIRRALDCAHAQVLIHAGKLDGSERAACDRLLRDAPNDRDRSDGRARRPWASIRIKAWPHSAFANGSRPGRAGGRCQRSVASGPTPIA